MYGDSFVFELVLLLATTGRLLLDFSSSGLEILLFHHLVADSIQIGAKCLRDMQIKVHQSENLPSTIDLKTCLFCFEKSWHLVC